jgi:hypothetical protein
LRQAQPDKVRLSRNAKPAAQTALASQRRRQCQMTAGCVLEYHNLPQATANVGVTAMPTASPCIKPKNVNTAPASAIAEAATIFSRWKSRCLLTGNLRDRGRQSRAGIAAVKPGQLPNKCAASARDAHEPVSRRRNACTSAPDSKT